ncbi:hypothetical protein [Gaiella sp.]|uniref:hypothetical protein n=1 Tax=Gaiella sp. TaxID=2663207 RepID=UPI002E34CB40|nr:hypothetical protein [Gaiella sp.]HEX5585288.1 hypothetical protein [Gaiella sp.]
MDTWAWIVIAVVAAAIVVALLAVWGRRTRRRSRLRDRFGSEYDRAVSDSGRKRAERRLAEVDDERDSLEITPLSESARERYIEEWRRVEAHFVDEPYEAARSAERILQRALAERGYPTGRGAEHRAAHLAVDHPDVVERYRHGQAMLDAVRGPEGTENLRKAMLDFRAVFEEIVEREPSVA